MQFLLRTKDGLGTSHRRLGEPTYKRPALPVWTIQESPIRRRCRMQHSYGSLHPLKNQSRVFVEVGSFENLNSTSPRDFPSPQKSFLHLHEACRRRKIEIHSPTLLSTPAKSISTSSHAFPPFFLLRNDVHFASRRFSERDFILRRQNSPSRTISDPYFVKISFFSRSKLKTDEEIRSSRLSNGHTPFPDRQKLVSNPFQPKISSFGRFQAFHSHRNFSCQSDSVPNRNGSAVDEAHRPTKDSPRSCPFRRFGEPTYNPFSDSCEPIHQATIGNDLIGVPLHRVCPFRVHVSIQCFVYDGTLSRQRRRFGEPTYKSFRRVICWSSSLLDLGCPRGR